MSSTLRPGPGETVSTLEKALPPDEETAHVMHGVETVGARIIVADDNPDMRDFVAELLERHWRVEAVGDGAAALESARSERPDLVIADAVTTGVDGLELTRRLRADPSNATVRVLLLSAAGGEQQRADAFEAGADDYLAKPFSARELIARVQSQVALSRLRTCVEGYREQIRELFSHTPSAVMVLRGPQLVYEVVNDKAYEMLGRHALVGRPIAEAGCDAVDQGVLDALQRVLETGEPYVASEARVEVDREGERVLGYYTLTAQRMRGIAGQEDGVVVFGHDVNELVEARRRSEELASKASEDARRKDEFLGMLGHELRNPLAPIAYAVDLLRLEQENVDQRRLSRTIDVIDRQTKQMARLVDDLLDVSRITRGTVKLQKKPTTLAEVVSSAVDTERPLVEARRHSLAVTVPELPVVLDVDSARMSQVFANLLNNAAKYTPEGGMIRLTARVEGGRCYVEVIDNGIGIDAEMLPRVFELFAQADESLDRARGGLGVGLTVVERLVAMHGGTAEAFSAGLGQGSRLVVSLPVEVADEAAEPKRKAPAEAPKIGPLKLLIVDGNRDAGESLAELLRMLGDDAATALTGDAALALVEGSDGSSYRPDVAFLDIGLPDMDGFELAKRLRRILGHEVMLISLTGYGRDADQGMARAAGFDHHVLKPADPAELMALLESVRTKRAAPAPAEPGK